MATLETSCSGLALDAAAYLAAMDRAQTELAPMDHATRQ
jgi:hypothetical protein